MPDREKVIRLIEEEISVCESVNQDYRTIDLPALRDILALLKEQEPVKPYLDFDGHDVWRCGNCYSAIYHLEHTQADTDAKNYALFCRHCGRKVKWE